MSNSPDVDELLIVIVPVFIVPLTVRRLVEPLNVRLLSTTPLEELPYVTKPFVVLPENDIPPPPLSSAHCTPMIQ